MPQKQRCQDVPKCNKYVKIKVSKVIALLIYTELEVFNRLVLWEH
jgi:hypothetical protein